MSIDKVASAKKKMNESKNEWVNIPIHFDMQRTQEKEYIGCVTNRKGITHIYNNTPCQDNCLIDFIDPDKKEKLIIAVGDGHGDKKHDLSQDGSEMACDVIVSLAREILKKEGNEEVSVIEFFTSVEFKIELVKKWKSKVLEKYSTRKDFDPTKPDSEVIDKYGTTLLFAIEYKEFYVVGQLGDGGIVILNNDDEKCRIHKYRPDKKIGGGTNSLCMEYAEAFVNMKVYPKKEVSGIVLMTDGYYDLWESDKKLFEASRFFVNTLILKDSSEAEIKEKYSEKYNEAVEYASDDISIGVLANSSSKTEGRTNSTIKEMHSSCMRTTVLLSGEKQDKGIFFNSFLKLKDKNQTERISLFDPKKFENTKTLSPHIIIPHGPYIVEQGYLLYGDLADGYLTLDDYCERFIVSKNYSMDIRMSIMVLINIITTIKDDKELFNTVGLLELSDMIEFSPKDGNVKIYWINFPPDEKGNESLAEIVAKYAINFLGAGRLYYNDKAKNDIKTYLGSWYEKNLRKYTIPYIKKLMNGANTEDKIEVEDLLEDTCKLQDSYIQCSSCRTVSILSEESRGQCACGKTFEIVAKLVSDVIRIPISVNTIISVWNSDEDKYEDIIDVLKQDEEIGFKNISNEKWTVTKKDDQIKSVEPNRVVKLSDSKKFKIRDCEYSIAYNLDGDK
jgi:serine/threonine protein phosphatase PrpC